MTDIPASAREFAREFERWYVECEGGWPDELRATAYRALLTLKSLDQPNLSPAFLEASKADLQAFAVAYAEWRP